MDGLCHRRNTIIGVAIMTEKNHHSPRRPTPYCRDLCQKFDVRKKRYHSIYELNARCHNCEAYIPRTELIMGATTKIKAKCPCCNKPWLKGVYPLQSKLRRDKTAANGGVKPVIKFTIKSIQRENVPA